MMLRVATPSATRAQGRAWLGVSQAAAGPCRLRFVIKFTGTASEKPNLKKVRLGLLASGHLRKATFQQPDLCGVRNSCGYGPQISALWMNAEVHPKRPTGRHSCVIPLGFRWHPQKKPTCRVQGEHRDLAASRAGVSVMASTCMLENTGESL